jgi:hypothetical protein
MNSVEPAIMSNRLTIEMLTNGYELEYEDPEIRAKNRKSDDYQDPYKKLAFTKQEEVLAAVGKILPLMSAKTDDEETDFDVALAEAVGETSGT